jgi:hypothetical protein
VTLHERDGEKAGIIAFQNEEYYYLLSVGRVSGGTVARLEKHAGPQPGDDGSAMIADGKSHLEPRA